MWKFLSNPPLPPVKLDARTRVRSEDEGGGDGLRREEV